MQKFVAVFLCKAQLHHLFDLISKEALLLQFLLSSSFRAEQGVSLNYSSRIKSGQIGKRSHNHLRGSDLETQVHDVVHPMKNLNLVGGMPAVVH